MTTAACSQSTSTDVPDLAVCDGYVCTGGCDSDRDCKAGSTCDPVAHACYACHSDSECPAGQLCGRDHTCVSGCSAGHDCAPDSGVCELDAGVCIQCLVDGDCTDQANPRCDVSVHACVACLPATDNCGYASFCQPQKVAGYVCSPGCKTSADCVPLVDAGANDDASVPVDGGAPGPQLQLCDQVLHQCVRCLADADCPLGNVCKNDACVAGCTNAHACPDSLTCCSGQCSDITSDAKNCSACGLDCGAGNCCNSACSDPTKDAMNCGGCGIGCAVKNGVAACNNRSCAIGACSAGWADCNFNYADGCETHTDVNVNNCGACNALCVLDHATPTCIAGACDILTCVFPYFDCDKKVADGCEINVLSTDLKNCGSCGTVCAPANATPACTQGVCHVKSCTAPFADCDGDAANGCEVNTNITVANCGGCGNACVTPHATPSCIAAACQIASCDAGYADCDMSPKSGCEINIAADAVNCGKCGNVCSSNHGTPSCVASTCQIACAGGFANCNADVADGCEISLLDDLKNCGSCGNACSLPQATATCASGACAIAACNAGWADCNKNPKDGCEVNIGADTKNCGSCSKVCGTANGAASCTNGTCHIACNNGWSDCNLDPNDGCEIDTTTSVGNCGACAAVCVLPNATPSCKSSACAITSCNAGYADCDASAKNGCEINVKTDPANCSACGFQCSNTNGTASCANAACHITCAAGFGDCDGAAGDGCEVTFATDARNCGACGTVCTLAHATPSCVANTCKIASCDAGYADCNGVAVDGCEVNLNTDATHCGACATVCSSLNGAPSCTAGTCKIACSVGFGNCSGNVATGCETNLNTDVKNCNACGTVCSLQNATPACSGGACTVALCSAGWQDCNAVAADGCEVHTAADPKQCGACGKACSTANGTASCVASVCQIACDAGYSDCNKDVSDGCEINLNTNTANCGSCGAACVVANAVPGCAGGACTVSSCVSGYADCDGSPANGCEIHTAVDTINCGACGKACSQNNGTPTCANSVCSIACAAGFGDCNHDATDGCEITYATDVLNCGSCGFACALAHATPACGAGACQILKCDAGYADCNGQPNDGCEANLNADIVNCGTCGYTCSANNGIPSCGGGTCTIACSNDYADCDNNVVNGCEVHLTTDPGNCSACGTVCALANAVQGCAIGQCTVASCNAGYADCNAKPVDGCEIDTNTDVSNCNACGAACVLANAVPHCTAGACGVTSCNPGYADCDASPANGCEINTTNNVVNCGSCGFSCNAANGTPSCAASACHIACNVGYGDCNASAADGCEITFATDVSNCGGCGQACKLSHATPTCGGATCLVAQCDVGFADCNGQPADGCEINLNTDAVNCGGCNSVCSTVNGAASCLAGSCAIACNAGFGDCNASAADGCEVNLNTDVNNCAVCGDVCALANAAPACTAGACTVATCNATYADCNKVAADGCEIQTATDALNCSACGKACSTNNGTASCANSACAIACNANFDDCNKDVKDGCEVNLLTSVGNCGSCGSACVLPNASPVCTNGACAVSLCSAGYADCNALPGDGCEIHTTVDAANCGACGFACNATNGAASCVASACKIACGAGFGDCNASAADGCEITFATDVKNCGGCGLACSLAHATPTCSAATCKVSACDPGYADCDGLPANGCEINLNTDPVHCGVCATVCSSQNGTAGCAGGGCTISCKAGYGDCDHSAANGCEVNLLTDTANCNGCGTACVLANATPSCVAGACQVAACGAGYADCNAKPVDGCEINTATNVLNCSGCGKACGTANGTASCVNSSCQIACSAGFANCDGNTINGCEVNMNTDVNNCSGCGTVCALANAVSKCGAGACAVASCTAGYSDCNALPVDGCEVHTTADAANCGACGTVCNNVNGTPSCVNSACQIACTVGFGNCDSNLANGCESTFATDVNNCGGCGNACVLPHATASCGSGACKVSVCVAGWADCNGIASDGCEVNLTNDANNCNACGSVCALANATATCVAGACAVAACNAGFGNCNAVAADGCEVNLNATPASCGGCGSACPGTNMNVNTCTAGNCTGTCTAGFGNCDGNFRANGCEVNTTTSVANCGACGTACPGTNMSVNTCTASVCTGTCNAGFGNCDGNLLSNGCEANTVTSDGQVSGAINHCGSCGGSCPLTSQAASTSCGGSACHVATCNAGFGDCNGVYGDGCEINTTNNLSNCGSCGHACSAANVATYTCGGSACSVGSCNANYWNTNGAFADGCECYTGNGNSGVQNACGSQNELGTLAVAGSTTQTGTIAGTSTEHWYAVAFSSSGASYHPHVVLTTTAGSALVMDVQLYNCAVTGFGCSEGGTSLGLTSFETNQTAGDPTTGGTQGAFTWVQPGNVGQFSPGTKLLVRVRGTAAASCSTYSLLIQNG